MAGRARPGCPSSREYPNCAGGLRNIHEKGSGSTLSYMLGDGINVQWIRYTLYELMRMGHNTIHSRVAKTTILPTEVITDSWGARGMGALPTFLQICQGSYGMRGGWRHESGARDTQERLSMCLQSSQH